MRKLVTDKSMVGSVDATLPAKEDVPDKTGANVLLPDLDPQRTYNVMSRRLVHKEQAKDFVQEVIEETP
jgi:hypothetical protein